MAAALAPPAGLEHVNPAEVPAGPVQQRRRKKKHALIRGHRNGFQSYFVEQYKLAKKSSPEIDHIETRQTIAQQWNALPKAEKDRYRQLAHNYNNKRLADRLEQRRKQEVLAGRNPEVRLHAVAAFQGV